MSRTTVLVFVIAFGAVFGVLVLLRPQPLREEAAALADDLVLRIDSGRSGPAWQYIVIHHTKTIGGTGELFDRYYREAWGQDLGMGWHFLVEPEIAGRANICTGARWRLQADGFHTFDSYDRCAIGIAVVGLMQSSGPSEAQFRALVWLVRRLQQVYRIPADRVLLHRDIDAGNPCPGPGFPVDRFRRELLQALPAEPLG